MRLGLGLLGGGYLGLSAWMFSQEAAMRADGGSGIVGFELAGSAGRVEEILAAWGPDARSAARRSLLIDYGVLSCYGPLMARLCRSSAERLERRGHRRLSRLGSGVATGQLVAAGFDIAENTALLAVLAGRRGALPQVARASAVAKFALLGAGLAYVAAGFRPG